MNLRTIRITEGRKLCISSVVGDVFGRLAGLGSVRSMAREDIGVLREVETGLLVGVRDGGVEAVPGGGNTAPGTHVPH